MCSFKGLARRERGDLSAAASFLVIQDPQILLLPRTLSARSLERSSCRGAAWGRYVAQRWPGSWGPLWAGSSFPALGLLQAPRLPGQGWGTGRRSELGTVGPERSWVVIASAGRGAPPAPVG